MLSYTAICSADGYIEDAGGRFDWAQPDEAVHAFANELDRSVDTHLYGRRLYEVMQYWEDPAADSSAVEREYGAIWRDADKIVVSRRGIPITTARTVLWDALDADRVRALPGHTAIGGADLAGQALALGLVDELRLLLFPVIVGGGKRALPEAVSAELALLEQQNLGSGVVFLRYAIGH